MKIREDGLFAGQLGYAHAQAVLDDVRIQLRAKSPLRSRAAQADANHLPLFVAANEPVLL